MITDLAPLAPADVAPQPYRPGAPLPRPDGRADVLRLRCAVGDLPTLARALPEAGPRVRLEVAGESDWPVDVDVARLVSGGVVELALQLPDVLDADTSVCLIGLLVAAREHGLDVDWRLPHSGLPWVDAQLLHHLPPPSAGDDAAVRSWRGAHRFGQLYWRRGPGFVTVIDARGKSRIRYVIDETPLLETFHALTRPGPIDALPPAALAELVEAELAVAGEQLATGLAYRLRHTPMPGYQV